MKTVTPTLTNPTATKPTQPPTVVEPSSTGRLVKLTDHLFQTIEAGWLILLVTVLAMAARLLTVPAFVESREGILYVRGVIHYSVVEMRPYWPGYPVYMWLGQLFNLLSSDPVRALHILSVASSTLCIWPLAALAYEWRRAGGASTQESKLAALGATVTWALVPIAWLNGSEIFGDPTALLLSLVMLWLCWQSLQSGSNAAAYLLPAAVLAGLILGIRLAYLPLLLVLVYATWKNRNYKLKWKILPYLIAVVFGLTIAIWFGWQLAMDGLRFFEVGKQQLSGHYSEWGDSALSDNSMWTRPVRLIKTYLIYGLGSWWPGTTWLRWPVTLLFLALTINGVRRIARSSQQSVKVIALIWTASYLLCTLINFDVDLTRYYFPLIAINCVVAAMGLPTNWKWGYPVLLATAVALALVVIPLSFEHQHHPPLGVQLTDYTTTELNQATSTIIISDDTPALVFFMQNNAPTYQMMRVFAPNLTQQTQKLVASGHTVYATWLPGDAPVGWVPVARLCRNPLLESRGPLEMGLYRYSPAAAFLSVSTLSCYNDSLN